VPPNEEIVGRGPGADATSRGVVQRGIGRRPHLVTRQGTGDIAAQQRPTSEVEVELKTVDPLEALNNTHWVEPSQAFHTCRAVAVESSATCA